MHAPTHRKAAIARDLRVERAKRLANERSRRNAAVMARVAAAPKHERMAAILAEVTE